MQDSSRSRLKDKKRIVIKVGSSTITYPENGRMNLNKIEHMVREISDLKGMGKEVILVSSGAIAAGRTSLGFKRKERKLSEKQAFAAVGQAKLMMIYQKIFSEYNMTSAQILLTKANMVDEESRNNAHNTFSELLKLGAVPIVNENDTVSTAEIRFGDNDRLSAIVASLVEADLLILLSDIDGLYSDDPNVNKNARFISTVRKITPHLLHMGKESSGSDFGTGGMQTKLEAAKIACGSGADMVIASGKDMDIIGEIIEGKRRGTLFSVGGLSDFDLDNYMHEDYRTD